MFTGDTSEYYGGTYPSPPEDYDEEEKEEEWEDNYEDWLLEQEEEDN